jgi:hypothetical protein
MHISHLHIYFHQVREGVVLRTEENKNQRVSFYYETKLQNYIYCVSVSIKTKKKKNFFNT